MVILLALGAVVVGFRPAAANALPHEIQRSYVLPRSKPAVITCAAISLIPLGLLNACSADSAGPALTIEQTAKGVAQAPMLHWSGSWQVSGVTVTADLRALGTGDVFGTLRADGRTAEVILVDDEYTYIKADREMWRSHLGASDKEAEAFGGRWVDDRGTSDPSEADSEGPPITGEILGLDLAWLAPGSLGRRLSDYSPGDATATATPRPAWSAAPSASGRTDRPGGVPSTARHFDMPDGEATGKRTEGTYWVSADSPHRLVGYSGFEAVSTTGGTAGEPAELTVRSQSPAQAKAAYADLIRTVESLPSTLPVRAAVTENSLSVDSDFTCGPSCATGMVSVIGENTTRDLIIRAVTVNVVVESSDGSAFGGPGEEVGSCTTTLPGVRPGKSVEVSCEITDPRLRAAYASADDLGGGYKDISFHPKEGITSFDPVKGTSHVHDVVATLRNNQKDVGGNSGNATNGHV